MIGHIIGATCAFILFFFLLAAPLREGTRLFQISRALMWTGVFVFIAECVLGIGWLIIKLFMEIIL